jgi:predicted DCC family thiol-disulfide oxidoreductase YuxK
MKTTRQPRPTMLFDGGCPFCRKWVKRLQGMLHNEEIAFRSLTEESILTDFPGVSHEALMKSIHYIAEDGTIQTGMDAIVAALSLRKIGKVSRALRMPGLRQLSDAAYRMAATRRFREEQKTEGCGTASCNVQGTHGGAIRDVQRSSEVAAERKSRYFFTPEMGL